MNAAGRAAQASCTAEAPALAAGASASRVATALRKSGIRHHPARATALSRTGRNELRHAQRAAAAPARRRRLRVAAWKPPATMDPEAEEESDYYAILVRTGPQHMRIGVPASQQPLLPAAAGGQPAANSTAHRPLAHHSSPHPARRACPTRPAATRSSARTGAWPRSSTPTCRPTRRQPSLPCS